MSEIDEPQKIVLNFDSIRGEFYRAMQRQLDIVSLLIGGAQHVTELQVWESRGFHNFNPAHGAELSHEFAKEAALDWLQCAFLRDAIESTGLFLDRCLVFCGVVDFASNGACNAEAFNKQWGILQKKYKKLHFPALIETLERQLGTSLVLSGSVLSLNKVRSCLVHRLGKVSSNDSNYDGELRAKWLSTKTYLKGQETGTELVLDAPGGGLNEESLLMMQIIEHERVFKVGESISLTSYEVFSTIFTLWQFGRQCAEQIQIYTLAKGIKPLEATNQ